MRVHMCERVCVHVRACAMGRKAFYSQPMDRSLATWSALKTLGFRRSGNTVKSVLRQCPHQGCGGWAQRGGDSDQGGQLAGCCRRWDKECEQPGPGL